jgi:hypothetical protein
MTVGVLPLRFMLSAFGVVFSSILPRAGRGIGSD